MSAGDLVGAGGLCTRAQAFVDTVIRTVFEALKAYDALRAEGAFIRVIDLYSVQPVDGETLVAAARVTGAKIITVEDHYVAGGVGDAVAEAIAPAGFTVHRLGVTEIPRSGKPEELLDRFGISAAHIVTAVREMLLVNR